MKFDVVGYTPGCAITDTLIGLEIGRWAINTIFVLGLKLPNS